MIRVGIVAEENSKIFYWEKTKLLLDNSNIDLVYFIETPKNPYPRRMRSIVPRIFWRVIETVEAAIFGGPETYHAPPAGVRLDCYFERWRKVFPQSEINKIKDSGVEIMIRLGGRGIYTGEFLTCLKHGVISIHHGDNRAFRGGPPGFWEILSGHPQVGYIVQRLNEKLDGGTVLDRGHIKTKRYFAENRREIYELADVGLAKIIQNVLKHGKYACEEENGGELGKIYSMPGFSDIVRYLSISWLRPRSPGN